MKRVSDDESPLMSVEVFPLFSAETVFEKKRFPRVGKFKKQRQKTKKAARWQKATSLHEVKREVNDVQELNAFIRVEENDDQPELHAVSDSNRWMSICPLSRFITVKIGLDSEATAVHQIACVPR